MEIRQATLADTPALANLRWTWRVDEEGGDPTESREEFVTRFTSFAAEALSGRWTVWVVESDDEVIANIWIYKVPKVPSPGVTTRDFGYMTNVYTVPTRRSSGVGSRLLEAVRAWAHEVDLELLIVWPSDASVPWYRRGGYIPAADTFVIEVAGYEG
jgi:GNAT superfamily N-acetyltransferase